MRVRDDRSGPAQPGWYMVSLVRGGIQVPARLWCPCHCTIHGGRFNDAHDPMDDCDRPGAMRGLGLSLIVDGQDKGNDPELVEKVWLFGTRITEPEYRFQMDLLAWRRANSPYDSDIHKPHQPVDLAETSPLF